MNILTNYSLKNRNTFGIEASAQYFFEYTSVDELKEFIREERWKSLPKLHIGGGSNLLFLKDFSGVVLHSCIKTFEIVEENEKQVFVKVGAGVKWDDFVSYCVANNYYGAENLSYIPGEVGASPVQNVGAYGVEAKDIIYAVELIETQSAETVVKKAEDCGFAYRFSNFKQLWKDKYYVTHVVFKLKKNKELKLEYGNINEALNDKEKTLNSVRDAIVSIRKDKLPDPDEIGSAGSFFKNPVVAEAKYNELAALYQNMPAYKLPDGNVKIPAGWLIQQCDWKGKNFKHVGVYEKQALIIVNRGGATGEEVAELALLIKNDVLNKFGIEIHPEVCYIG